jgi:hypothetical protein
VAPQLFLCIGLVANLAGVILLFRYGMPYRVRGSSDRINFTTSNVNAEALASEQSDDAFSWLGLVLIVIATILQMIGTLLV